MSKIIEWSQFYAPETAMKTDLDIVEFLKTKIPGFNPTKLDYLPEHRNFDSFIFTDMAKSKDMLVLQPLTLLVLDNPLNHFVEHFAAEGKLSAEIREINKVMMVCECPQNLIHNYIPEDRMKEINQHFYELELGTLLTDTTYRSGGAVKLYYVFLHPKSEVEAYMEAHLPYLNYTLEQFPAMYVIGSEKVLFFQENGSYDLTSPVGDTQLSAPGNITDLSDQVLSHYRLRKLELLKANA